MMRNLLRQHAPAFSRPPVPPSLDEPDRLEAEHLQPLAAGHAGLPEATDSLAYDPVQRLLAVQIASHCNAFRTCNADLAVDVMPA